MKRLTLNRGGRVLAALLLLVLLGGAWRGLLYKPAEAAVNTSTPPIAVDTADVTQEDVPIYLQGLGTVQAYYTVTVTARIDGELQNVGFTEGQAVREGDLLALIDPRPAQAAYDQARATKAKDAAQLANAKRDLKRYKVLQPQDLASKQTVDTQHSAVDQLTAQLQMDQAQIDTARTNLSYTTITAPVDGRTGLRQIDLGNIVSSTDTTPLSVVTTLRPISVVFTLPQQDLPAVAGAAAGWRPRASARSRPGAGGG